MTAWNILFANDETVGIETYSTQCGIAVDQMLKHLQHVTVPFMPTNDNPYARGDVFHNLVQAGNTVGVFVNHDKLTDQLYLNHMHAYYEQAGDVSLPWLNFHNCIHAVEMHNAGHYPQVCWINWQHLGGPLAKPMSESYMKESTETVQAGDIFTDYAELGKPVYAYWRDNEPSDLNRLLQLSAP